MELCIDENFRANECFICTSKVWKFEKKLEGFLLFWLHLYENETKSEMIGGTQAVSVHKSPFSSVKNELLLPAFKLLNVQ